MIIYSYNKKDKVLHIKIHILLENVEKKPTEDELKEILPELLEQYINLIKNNNVRIYDNDKWNIL